MIGRPSVRDVAVALELDEPDVEAALVEHARALGLDSPWYLRTLMGAGAWVAGSFVLGFLFALDLLSGDGARALFGLALLVVATAARRAIGEDRPFGEQLALVGSVAGQGLVLSAVAGIAPRDAQVAAVCATAFAQAAVLLVLFPDAIQRFGAVVTMAVSLTLWLVLESEIGWATDALAVLVGAATATWWLGESRVLRSRWAAWHVPVGFGLAVALFVAAATSLASREPWAASWAAVAGLALVLLGVVRVAARDAGLSPPERLAAAWLVGGVCALLHAAPGIPAALLLLVLGVERRHPVLAGLASGLLVFFLGAFYYQLATTLLWKSAGLAGAGLLLLLARGALAWSRPR